MKPKNTNAIQSPKPNLKSLAVKPQTPSKTEKKQSPDRATYIRPRYSLDAPGGGYLGL